jgi:hypothetical protein
MVSKNNTIIIYCITIDNKVLKEVNVKRLIITLAVLLVLVSIVSACGTSGLLMLLVFAFNMVGDGLRDALDPRLRGAL